MISFQAKVRHKNKRLYSKIEHMKIGSLVKCIYQIKDGAISFTQQRMIDAGYVSPKFGEIYAVRGFTPSNGGLYLEELVNPPLETVCGYMEVGFSIRAFREVQPPMDLSELLQESLLQTA